MPVISVADRDVEGSYIRSKVEGTDTSDGSGEASDDSNQAPSSVKAMSKKQLVERYDDLVSRIARDIQDSLQILEVSIDDIRGYGFEGLLEAQQRFDPDKNVSFASYAYYRIRGAILDGFRSEGWSKRNQSYEILDYVAVNDYQEDHHRTRSSLPRSKTWRDSIRHIDQMVGDTVTILLMRQLDLQSLETTEEPPQREDVEKRQRLELLKEAIDELSDNEREVVIRYHLEEEAMSSIAEDLGYSKSWISRVNARAIQKIRDAIGPDEA